MKVKTKQKINECKFFLPFEKKTKRDINHSNKSPTKVIYSNKYLLKRYPLNDSTPGYALSNLLKSLNY